MTTAEIVLLIPVSFALTAPWAPRFIAALRRLKFGKQIREEGPSSHQVKKGTPTLGGWLFVVAPVILCLALVPDRLAVCPALVAMVIFATVGALDDYANMRSKTGHGFQVRNKFLWHGLICLALAYWLYQTPAFRSQRLPGGAAIDLGLAFIPFAAVVIFAAAAAVNEIDGLDGLAGGTSLMAFLSYLALALVAGLTAPAAVCAAVAGAIVGFLWFNVHPARVFMGDTGALALGAGLAIIALQTRWVVLLPIIGLPAVIATASVIIQVAYFKATKGKRFFKMSPIHHHLELSGWPETQIVERFWLFGLLVGAAGVALGLLS
ncbi:MAG TPA: phospho-N-acetylmuramoyl-pentapeptide-transferase [Chloroflexota bacterium]|nr:phospho-N-acetylmuramoyl-pentapeptide-transferase [Chloroflexota bacterium]